MEYSEFIKKDRAIALILSEEKLLELSNKMKNKRHHVSIEFNDYDDVTKDVEFFIVGLGGYCPKDENQKYVRIQNDVDIYFDDIQKFILDYNMKKKTVQKINFNESNIIYVENSIIKKLKLNDISISSISKCLENIESENFRYHIHNPSEKLSKYINSANIKTLYDEAKIWATILKGND